MWLILLGFIFTLLAIWMRKVYTFWSKNGIPGPKPMPLVGNFGKSLIGAVHSGDILTDAYRKYAEYPFFGMYRNLTPLLVIRDPEFIKTVLVKNFKHFHDNDIEVDKEVDPIMGRNPFMMKGTEWRNKRAQLTPCFTSGKIKGMYPFLRRNAERMVKYIEYESKLSKYGLEASEICVRFTLNNVASCAFGIEGKAFDEESPDFKKLADRFISPDGATKYVWLLFFLSPELIKKFKLKLIPKDVEDRLLEIVRKTLKHRKENNVVLNDFLDAVSNLPTEHGLFSEFDIVGHAASFFGDGYQTSHRVMSFLLFELASNSDVQEKLRNEIDEALAETNGEFTYELIHDNKYLDACWNESLRKNSIMHALIKVCTEDFSYTSTNPEFKPLSVNIKAGDSVQIPIRGLNMDAKYFEEPDKFMPERFLNDTPINKYAFLAFGEGPRACLGIRFAQTQIKVGVAYIIKHFKLTVSSKTQLPLKYDPNFFMRHAIGGLWIHFEKIE